MLMRSFGRSDDSVAAAKLALAANKQGKYFEMHQKLFSESVRANKDKALRIAKELALDIAQLQKDAENPDIKKAASFSRHRKKDKFWHMQKGSKVPERRRRANVRLRESARPPLIGYMRISKADGSQALDLQRDALAAAPLQ
jgi:hypothetical protein